MDVYDALRDYVREVANLAGLRDYTFEVAHGPLPPGDVATCRPIEGRRYARITVCEEFFDLDTTQQREAIVHEVLHPHLHPLVERIRDLRPELGRAHYESFETSFLRDTERIVDALTSAFVEHVPYPDALLGSNAAAQRR